MRAIELSHLLVDFKNMQGDVVRTRNENIGIIKKEHGYLPWAETNRKMSNANESSFGSVISNETIQTEAKVETKTFLFRHSIINLVSTYPNLRYILLPSKSDMLATSCYTCVNYL